MGKQIKLKGKLRVFMNLSLFLGILLAALTIITYFYDYRVGIILTVFVVFYFAAQIILFVYNRPLIVHELISFATEYGQVQKQVLRELQLPHALLDEKGKVIWTNNEFEKLTHQNRGYGKNISNLFAELTQETLPTQDMESQVAITYENGFYQAKMKRIVITDMVKNSTLLHAEDYEGYLIGLYLFDETALRIALREIDDQSLAVGLIYLDNFEEALDSLEEVKKSLFLALIDRRINKYISALDGIVRKTEKDKFMVILRKKSLTQLKETNFEILENVKTVKLGDYEVMPVTISIGIGVDGLTYSQNCEFARAAIDLALGRGGDQAVIKSPGSLQYFGGKSQQMEKSTRVKARVKAQALAEIIPSRDRVFVMGHRLADVDSFGAAIGVCCIARSMDKKAHIIMNDITASLRPLVDMVENSNDYEDDMIINSQQALEIAGNNALMVVVDINKPSITECPDMLKYCKSIVVLDHHRQGAETIDNATLSYVEPYASSACEMVAEILQYIDSGVKIKGLEADCLYSGIMIDTNNFMTKTGVRTFEAAAFLRRNGADVTRVRKLFREDASEYMVKAKAVRDAMIYRDCFAISICDSEAKSPTIIAAQAANELLNINGIRASFVFTDYQNRIYLSGRSIDENVQIILEKLGGGGHMTIAGAQFENTTIDEAIHRLQEVLDEMLETGEIRNNRE